MLGPGFTCVLLLLRQPARTRLFRFCSSIARRIGWRRLVVLERLQFCPQVVYLLPIPGFAGLVAGFETVQGGLVPGLGGLQFLLDLRLQVGEPPRFSFRSAAWPGIGLTCLPAGRHIGRRFRATRSGAQVPDIAILSAAWRARIVPTMRIHDGRRTMPRHAELFQQAANCGNEVDIA